ncbi:pentapeptide repeat-containing protein [Solitalea canadensis]|uniref:Putative low-complexity protein n=1 Tax=Solitalea canadensis (strain ATCC 29591 / DSM 3403 / JCM 21819 / LMG 8368 / NBRC 15130 / NCIMB 12057 / USAM 9D) TaxID=929556 RepID=H8KKV4_SOLCM|nr:pentapeptide repeat-containing protein [Solitalea canadensis]AFD08587.1 putative low-complexity protein [Solitalea canadensis DSM 3403]
MQNIIEKYKKGHRYFINLSFEGFSKMTGQILVASIFDNCNISVDCSHTDLTNVKFINCNLKKCDFTHCDLTNATFENCSFENVVFKNADLDGTTFIDCNSHGQMVYLDKITGELETIKHPLVKELYDNVPEFSKIADHLNDELDYLVYSELSLRLVEDITTNTVISDLTKQCFQFFNLLGDREDEKLDNLLVVGVYEGLYPSKKCNDIARQLLNGRNNDIYEHCMKNENIRSNF